MDEAKNRRIEARLCYQWPVLYAQDFKQTLSEGLMVDVSSGGLAFMCREDENCPQVGQKLVTRFSIPRSQEEDFSAMTSFTRSGLVLRVDHINSSLCQVAIQFDESLSLKPSEQANIDRMHSMNFEQ